VNEIIKVFRQGKKIPCTWSYENGGKTRRITDQGDGEFFPDEFASVADAEAFCRLQLADDPSLYFLIVRCDFVLDIVIDEKWRAPRDRRDNIIYGVVSTAVFASAACLISVYSMELETFKANFIFVASITAIYLFLLLIMGCGNIEGAVAMTVLLFAIWLNAGAVPKIKRIIEYRRTEAHAAETRPAADGVDP
jgi:hypothetical protein